MRDVAFVPKAFEDLSEWAAQDKKIYAKIVELIKDIQRN
jgi:toxin YoeB